MVVSQLCARQHLHLLGKKEMSRHLCFLQGQTTHREQYLTLTRRCCESPACGELLHVLGIMPGCTVAPKTLVTNARFKPAHLDPGV